RHTRFSRDWSSDVCSSDLELGYRTAVLSTDPAHSLGDSFDRRIGNELVELAPNLWGQEIDLLNQMDKYWGRVQGYLNALFAWRELGRASCRERVWGSEGGG